MKLSTILPTILFLTYSASAYKICTYTDPNCEGDSKNVNVWDNTCRDSNLTPTQSFKVLAYGAKRQRAVFYAEKMCFPIPGDDKKTWWADGGGFKKGECVDVGFVAKAFGSQSA